MAGKNPFRICQNCGGTLAVVWTRYRAGVLRRKRVCKRCKRMTITNEH